MAEIFIGKITGNFENGNLQVLVEWSFLDTTPPFVGELQVTTQGKVVKKSISGSGTSGSSQAIASFVGIPSSTSVRVRGLISNTIVVEKTVTLTDDSPPIEPQIRNKSFHILFRDDSRTQQFVLEPADFEIIVNAQDVNFWTIENIQDINRSPDATTAQIFQIIDDKLGTLPDDSVDDSMVSQSIGVFEIKDNRITGEILYIANSSFNPFWYGKAIKTFVQIKDESGFVQVIKVNDITFTETQRDERLLINEFANGKTKLIVEFFVFVSPTDIRQFSKKLSITVEVDKPPPQQPSDGKSSVISKMLGGFFALTALTLLTGKGR